MSELLRGVAAFEEDWRAGEGHLQSPLTEEEIFAQLPKAHKMQAVKPSSMENKILESPRTPLINRALNMILRAITYPFTR